MAFRSAVKTVSNACRVGVLIPVGAWRVSPQGVTDFRYAVWVQGG